MNTRRRRFWAIAAVGGVLIGIRVLRGGADPWNTVVAAGLITLLTGCVGAWRSLLRAARRGPLFRFVPAPPSGAPAPGSVHLPPDYRDSLKDVQLGGASRQDYRRLLAPRVARWAREQGIQPEMLHPVGVLVRPSGWWDRGRDRWQGVSLSRLRRRMRGAIRPERP